MSHLSRNIMGFGQKLADLGPSLNLRFHDLCAMCKAEFAAGGSSILPVVNSPNYYSSPDRYVPLRPISVAPFYVSAKNGAGGADYVAFSARIAESGPIAIYNKGTEPCLRHLTSSQRQRCSASQLASTTMQSARLLALASAALLAKPLATTTALKAHLLAALSGHLLTTSKVAFENTTKIIETAAAGQPCVRRFCI